MSESGETKDATFGQAARGRIAPVARLPEEWQEVLLPRGERAFRAVQVFRWIHGHGVFEGKSMSNLPRATRISRNSRNSSNGKRKNRNSASIRSGRNQPRIQLISKNSRNIKNGSRLPKARMISKNSGNGRSGNPIRSGRNARLNNHLEAI